MLLVPCLLHDAYRYWLLADTGAARTLITPDVAWELDLDVQTPIRQERIASVHRVILAPVVRLASVQIGAQRLTDIEALVLPLPTELRVDGLLGVNVLEHFRTTFEFPQATIVLRWVAPQGHDSRAFQKKGGERFSR